MTTDKDPFIDDCFLGFVPHADSEQFELSMYSVGMELFHEQLSFALRC